MDFREYRAWYYFFQYQFFLRSSHIQKRITSGRDYSPVADFLKWLVYHTDEMHDRWETVERRLHSQQPEVSRRRRDGVPSMREQRRQEMLRTPEPGAEPDPDQKCRATLFFAERESIRCRFMLFNIPSAAGSHGIREIKFLYRCLVVYDLTRTGKSSWSIAKKLVEEKQRGSGSLWAAGQWRCRVGDPLWDGFLPFERMMKISYNSALDHTGTFAQLDLLAPFTQRNISQATSTLKGERDGFSDCIRSFASDIDWHKCRAEKLIELAASGHFSRFTLGLQSK